MFNVEFFTRKYNVFCHYERDHSQPDGLVLLCAVLETEKFTLNLFLQATTFLQPNFITRTTNIQTLGLNLTNLKKHMTIKNKRNIKPPIYRQRGRDWTEYTLHKTGKPLICSNDTM